MQGVGKKASLLLTGAAACMLLAACHGGSNSTPSTVPPTVGTFQCPVTHTTATTATPGIQVTCTATGSISADGATVTYNWNFGDQTLSTSTQPLTGNGVIHYYAQPGSYQVSLEVVDDHGTGATRIETINIPLSAVNSSVTPDGVQNWAWLSGPKTANSFGDFQTQFTPSALNQPSSRQSGASWANGGNLWMFGGVGYDSTGTAGYLNDLWMFNTASNQWTWVSGANRANSTGNFPATTGVTASTNVISARSAASSWTSVNASGVTTFWLFGGNGFDKNGNSSYLNDLWMLNSQTGEATWMAGSGIGNTTDVVGTQGVASTSNSPGGRSYASSWTDSNGIFWLFSGQTITSAGVGEYNNDLWSYDPAPKSATHPNGQQGWVLVSAATTATTFNASGVYGTQGTAASTNAPGARVSAQTWTDASGNLWLFGGSGFDANGSLGALNDIWMYNTATNSWTWFAGSNTVGATSVYGPTGSTKATTSGVPNVPGARVGTSGWVDSSGNLWMFGGSGTDSTSTTTANDGGGALNEVWAFSPTTHLWAFMGGVDVAGTAGVYITQVAPSTFSVYNTPGSRVWGTSWAFKGGFYLFGGTGLDAIGSSGYLSDLWTVQTVVPTN